MTSVKNGVNIFKVKWIFFVITINLFLVTFVMTEQDITHANVLSVIGSDRIDFILRTYLCVYFFPWQKLIIIIKVFLERYTIAYDQSLYKQVVYIFDLLTQNVLWPVTFNSWCLLPSFHIGNITFWDTRYRFHRMSRVSRIFGDTGYIFLFSYVWS